MLSSNPKGVLTTRLPLLPPYSSHTTRPSSQPWPRCIAQAGREEQLAAARGTPVRRKPVAVVLQPAPQAVAPRAPRPISPELQRQQSDFRAALIEHLGWVPADADDAVHEVLGSHNRWGIVGRGQGF